MSVLAPVAGKIGPLVRMLGSPVDGEALAACRAIGRTLASAKLDFHHLADALEHLPVVGQPKPEPAPVLKTWQLTAMHCIRAGQGSLKPVELDFLRSMVHWPSEPSDKQTRWLSAIAAALGVEVMA